MRVPRNAAWTPDANAGLAQLTATGGSIGQAPPLALSRAERDALTGRVAAVPRPVPRPARPALIDLSAAPSAMEERFAPERFK